VDECFEKAKRYTIILPPYTILISGGSNGLGDIPLILQKLKHATDFRCVVLCGKNEKLIHKIASWGVEHIQPIPFVSSREEMNDWYEQAVAMITKPGEITISEALCKKLPIFIYLVLPGQEEVNLRYLVSQKLAQRLDLASACEKQLLNVLGDEAQRNHWHHRIHTYHKSKDSVAWKKSSKSLNKKKLLNDKSV
jgi:processive 1,2-diacylglycerol beta-glucosyltransferase